MLAKLTSKNQITLPTDDVRVDKAHSAEMQLEYCEQLPVPAPNLEA
ncbi:hypothetical protein H0E84_09035 [Luteimonas sp. SJ-92]|uniref:Uncharacterized protein n=1 Tax=Luteimonas salinisoli TaxID=2752307 RepID=A0A853JD32_9GAMM|nr:hypothetical protein [Luteimonas salinisoli]NZA26529.1 hypothetical protein [Luteimonas salinisoli]